MLGGLLGVRPPRMQMVAEETSMDDPHFDLPRDRYLQDMQIQPSALAPELCHHAVQQPRTQDLALSHPAVQQALEQLQQQQQMLQQQLQQQQQQNYQQNYQNLRQGAQNIQATPQGYRDESHQIHSHMRQKAVTSLDDAVSILSDHDDDDAAGVLVVLVPPPRPISSVYFTVPSGVYCIMEANGQPYEKTAEDPIGSVCAEPGLHIKSFMTRVAYCVTKQVCTYDAPVKRCPTMDNVMCSVDLTIIFEITDPYDFVYNIGAAKADDLLAISIEEKVRTFIRQLKHTEIYTLRGAQATALQNGLNKIFKDFGITFHDVKVTGVWLPDQLASKLEMITKQETRMETIMAQHDYQILQVQQMEDVKIAEIQKNAEMAKIQEESKVKLEELNKEKATLIQEQKNREALLKSEQDAQDMEIKAAAEFRRAANDSKRKEKEALNDAKSLLLGIQLKAESDLKSGIAKSYDQLVVAKERAEIVRLQADVERAVGPQVALQRAHELSLQSKGVLSRLAENGDYNMIGKEGDTLIKSLLGGSLSSK